jgi:DNA polymerase-3 subunit epsilon
MPIKKNDDRLQELARELDNSDEYCVIRKYKKPEYYHQSSPSSTDIKKFIGAFLDIEATGLSKKKDKLIELGIVKFEYSADGRIFKILDEFHSYQDPKIPIPEFISKLTGIDDAMVRDQNVDTVKLSKYLEDVNLIIAHNSEFDRAFFETTFPALKPYAWACSMRDIDWKNEGIGSLKLDYIAYQYNFFYTGHRSISDCLASIHILSKNLPVSKTLVLKSIIDKANQLRFKLWATNAPYHAKELLKARGYRWNMENGSKHRAWAVEVTENNVEIEIEYLRSEVYNGRLNIDFDLVDACSRFTDKYVTDDIKYQDKIDWVYKLIK